MLKWLAGLGWIGWLICAAGAVLLAVAANVYILLARPFGATEGIPIDQTGPIGAIIGAIVPYVWLVLFAGMGSTFWLLVRQDARMNGAAWLVVLLILLCVGYPVYTGNLNQPLIALVANGVVIVIAALAAWRAGERRGWVRRSSCRSSRGYRWPRWRSVR
jgi:hypothetical protein